MLYYVESFYYMHLAGRTSRVFSSKNEALKEASRIYYATQDEVIVGESNTGRVLYCFNETTPHKDMIKKYLGRTI